LNLFLTEMRIFIASELVSVLILQLECVSIFNTRYHRRPHGVASAHGIAVRATLRSVIIGSKDHLGSSDGGLRSLHPPRAATVQ
jgi:hypothetical protein